MTEDDRTATGPDAAERADQLAAGLGACYIWYRVLTAQADRLSESQFVPDGYVFVVGLRNLRRAATLVASALTRTEDRRAVEAALAEFDRLLPGAQETRDRLEHIDDYGDGVGCSCGTDARHRHRPASEQVTVAVDVPPAIVHDRRTILYVGEFAVPIADATTASCLLLADVHAAAHSDSADVLRTEKGLPDVTRRVVPRPPELAA